MKKHIKQLSIENFKSIRQVKIDCNRQEKAPEFVTIQRWIKTYGHLQGEYDY